MNKRLVLRFIKASTLVVAAPLALLPAKIRFPAFARLSLLLSPLRRWLPSSTVHLRSIVSAADEVLYEVLSTLASRSRLEYDLRIHRDHGTAPGFDAGTGDAGVLIVGVHAMLMYLVVRHLHDLGHAPSVVAEDVDRKIYGTRIRPAYIGKTSNVLVRVKGVLENRGVVIALCDSAEPIPHAIPADLGSGPFWVSKALVCVAARTGASILFVYPRMKRGRLELVWGRPPPGEASPDAVMQAFVSFLAAQTRFPATGRPSRRPAMVATGGRSDGVAPALPR